MNSLRQYVCWNRQSVLTVTPRDAASLGLAQFQAIHHPLRLRKRPIGQTSGGLAVEEQYVTRVLTDSVGPDGYLLVPVVGASGSGKSHLVRWVYEQLHDRPDWEARYLPKNRTSLRRVIEIVCTGLEGASIGTVREALTAAPAHTDTEEVLAERLLDELALITTDPPLQSELNQRELQLRDKLQNELPDILRDPVVRRRLTSEGCVVSRLVGLALHGREHGDGLDDDEIYVTGDDMPVTFEEIGNVSKGARQLLTQMAANQTILDGVVDLINLCLPVAVKRVFLSVNIDLIEVFRDVRRELLRQQKELVLFIEDLTVMHGIEREFLDAIVEPMSASGGDICTLRVIFAVTEGHFDGLDTVRTRCEDAYWFDAPYGEDGVAEDEIVSFVARYLNACRLNVQAFEDSEATIARTSWPENACVECEMRIDCHDTFGKSEEGYGLYPFNRAAVISLISSLSSTQFDPREVVRRLVSEFLIGAESEMRTGIFPSDELLSAFEHGIAPLDPIVVTELKMQHPDNQEQLANVIRYWASHEDKDVPETVLDAFGLPRLNIRSVVEQSRSSGKSQLEAVRASRPRPKTRQVRGVESGSTGGVPGYLKGKASLAFGELKEWQGNQISLSATSTQYLRQLIHRTVLNNLDWSAAPINLGSGFKEFVFVDKHIYIEGTVTAQGQRSQIVIVDQTPETAVGLQGLILLEVNPRLDASVEISDVERRRYRQFAAQLVDQWINSVIMAIDSPPAEDHVGAVQGLLLSGMISDAFRSASCSTDYLANLFSAVPGRREWRSSAWCDLVQEASSLQDRLRPKVEAHFGEARGTGGVRGIQADVLLGMIDDITGEWEFLSADPTVNRLMRRAQVFTRKEWPDLIEDGKVFAHSVEMGISWGDQVKRILDVVQVAHAQGRLRDAHVLTRLRELAESTESISIGEIKRFVDALCSKSATHDRLRCIANPSSVDLRMMAEFLSRANSVMDQLEADVVRSSTNDESANELELLVKEILDAASRLSDGLSEIAKV